jgi:SnoaL-like domain
VFRFGGNHLDGRNRYQRPIDFGDAHLVSLGGEQLVPDLLASKGALFMSDDDVRVALQRHWEASDANDFVAEHEIYEDQAVLDYPQSGERIRGRQRIQASRMAQPNKKRFTVRRMLGCRGLWISEFVLAYDGQPVYVVSIMEFEGGKVVRETQYFGDPFEPGPSRAQWTERMSSTTAGGESHANGDRDEH